MLHVRCGVVCRVVLGATRTSQVQSPLLLVEAHVQLRVDVHVAFAKRGAQRPTWPTANEWYMRLCKSNRHGLVAFERVDSADIENTSL